jgi:hypothetical protein
MSKRKQVLTFWAESADSFEKASQSRRVLRPSHNIRLGTNEFPTRALIKRRAFPLRKEPNRL